MNCRDFQLQLAQLPDDQDVETVAHTQTCIVCSSLLKDRRRQEEWLRERFEKASIALLSKAPVYSGIPFSPAMEQPPFRLSWVIGSIAALATVIVGLWHWNGLGWDTAKPVSSESLIPAHQSAQLTAKNPPDNTSPKVFLPPPVSKLSDTARSQRLLTNASPTPASSSMPVVSSPLSPQDPLVAAAHVFKMEPTGLAPDANGYLATIVPNDPTTQAPAMVALSLSGLPANSLFHIRTSDVNGQQVWLASLMTDANGLGAVMLRTSADVATSQKSARPNSQRTTADPIVDLDLGDDDSPPGGAIDVVDNTGNTVLHVSQTRKPKHKRSQ